MAGAAPPSLRPATARDLATVASWICSPEACRLWCGERVRYPIDLATLADAVECAHCESWLLCDGERAVGFGQVVPKPNARRHLARLIVAPERRGSGLGRRLTTALCEIARAASPRVVSLNVARDNGPALALYTSLGFVDAKRPADETTSAEASARYMELA